MWKERSSAAIKNDIAIYAIHTNLDNVIDGVNGKIADIWGWKYCHSFTKETTLLKSFSPLYRLIMQRRFAMPFLQQAAGILAITVNAVLIQRHRNI